MLYVALDLALADSWADCLAEDRAAELEALAELVANECHPKQRGFATDPGLRISALVGRGGGKTTAGRVRFLRRMLTTPRAQCLYIATTREQAEKLMWAPLKDLCAKLNIDAKFSEDKLRCTFRHNGATLSLAGADDKKQIEKYRGIPHHEVGIDECASFPPRLLEHLIDRIIVPRLGDYDGCLWLIGTPGHILNGPFYDITRPGSDVHRRWDERELEAFDGWTSWSHHDWTLVDAVNAGVRAAKSLWAAAQREKDNKGWGDDHPVWRREYLGQWAGDDTEMIYRYRPHDEAGKPFNVWDPERDEGRVATPPGPFRDRSYVYGMDFGGRDPFALQVFAYSPTDPSKTLWHVFEFEQRGMYARSIARLLLGEVLDHEDPTGILGQTGWPESMAGDGSASTLLDELKNVYGLHIEPAPRKFGDKLDSIELFNGDLQEGRIKILKGSKLEEQLASLHWIIGESGEQREDKSQRNDCADAAIYARRMARHLLSEEEEPPAPALPPVKRTDPTNVWDEPRSLLDDPWAAYDGSLFDEF